MFKVGSIYRFKLGEGNAVSEALYEVVEIEHPLVKIRNPHFGPDQIINTASNGFVSAELVDEEGGDSYWKSTVLDLHVDA